MDILKKFTTGIYVLGVRADGVRNAMTASWVTQVSFEPLMVMVAVKKTRFTRDLLLANGKFTISVLRKDQADIVGKFKGPKEVTEDAINGVPVLSAANGAPFLKDSVGYVECTVVNEIEAGDHTIFIGEVTGGTLLGDAPALVSTDLDHIYGG